MSTAVIVVEHGTPVRLTFVRQETAACCMRMLRGKVVVE